MKNIDHLETFIRQEGDYIRAGDISVGVSYDKDTYQYVKDNQIRCQVVEGETILCVVYNHKRKKK